MNTSAVSKHSIGLPFALYAAFQRQRVEEKHVVCKGSGKRAMSHLLSESFLLKIEAFIKLVIRKSQLPFKISSIK